ncbi:MAG: c-type cytochrome [Nitrospinota bacterium]
MKQIYCGFVATFLLVCVSCAPKQEQIAEVDTERLYRITVSDPFGRISSEFWTVPKLEALGVKKLSSSYFDRALRYSHTEFKAVSLLKIVSQFRLKSGEDAILLNCFDDYQGILPISDILKYDLYLATRIKLENGSSRPGWLNPLLVLVPDGKNPPFEERFLTANIRELKFVRLSDYYSPLKKLSKISGEAEKGFEVYKNNCLFCHSLRGRGGNKGIRINKKYQLSDLAEQKKFLKDFKNFHDKNNADKQDVEQFVTVDQLIQVMSFLRAVGTTK